MGGGFKHFLFSSLPGEMIQFDEFIFFKWVGEKPPTSLDFERDVHPGSSAGVLQQTHLQLEAVQDASSIPSFHWLRIPGCKENYR